MEEIVNYLANHQEKANFPDREAKQIRNHPFMTQLDFLGTNEEQKRAREEEKRQEEVKEIATQMKSSEALERTKRSRTSKGNSAIVDPYTGGRGPDVEILAYGKSRGQARDEYDDDVRMKCANPSVWYEHAMESNSLRSDREGKSNLATQAVRFFDSKPRSLMQINRGPLFTRTASEHQRKRNQQT